MFKVPIIPPDLRHEETIIQTGYALDCLQNTIATIFGRIDKRIEKNNVKVKELQERISKSQAKINSLHGTRKAIRIYAPARFPATSIFRDLPVTFDERHKDLKSIAKYHVESKLDTNLPSCNEKLIFFHVRDQNSVKFTPESHLSRERSTIKQNQDLGNMPSDIRSVTSVLLFNTDVSVYNVSQTPGHSESYKRSKLLKNKQQHGNTQPVLVKQILEPAPHSLIYRRTERLTPSGGLKYTPKLSEAPELDLPLDLPDLPGIADDLRYDSPEAKQKIAPSLAIAVENLPDVTELIKDSQKTAQNSKLRLDNNRSNPAPPPPPPMPPNQSPVPPPPPPPPSIERPMITTKSNTANKIDTSTDTRSELMAAIRNAGGIGNARLRASAAAPVTSSDNDVVDNTRPHSSSTKKQDFLRSSKGSDLMADLHNKLLMRRKGISGSKESKDENTNIKNNETIGPTGNPVISRLSALIPPPPATKPTARNTTNTSEEDDEDDSNDWVD